MMATGNPPHAPVDGHALDEHLIKNIFSFMDVEDVPKAAILGKTFHEFFKSDNFWLPLVRRHYPAIEDQLEYLKDGAPDGESPKSLRDLFQWRKTRHLESTLDMGSTLQQLLPPDAEMSFGLFIEIHHPSLPYGKATMFTDDINLLEAREQISILTPTWPSLVFNSEESWLDISVTNKESGLQAEVFNGKFQSANDISATVARLLGVRWNRVSTLQDPVTQIFEYYHLGDSRSVEQYGACFGCFIMNVNGILFKVNVTYDLVIYVKICPHTAEQTGITVCVPKFQHVTEMGRMIKRTLRFS